jgi:peptidoglycan-N-acetylmuramic acid deacetylase
MEETLKKYLWGNKVFGTRIFPTLCFLAAAFLLGRAIAGAVAENRYDTQNTTPTSAGTSTVALGTDGTVGTLEQSQTWGLLFTENWGLGFGESGKCPTGNSSAEELKKYNAYFVGDTTDKKIYLTFDCGYENGNTEAILDALKKHNASATFFVVGHYLESAPDLVKRMVAEGHTVGNHTYHHPDMSQISDKAAFQKEMDDVRSLYKEVTGEEMVMYYRPPQGKYSIANLQMAQELGYATFFWSLAYVDWNVDDQPSHEEAFNKLTKRIHPGAIVLLHNTSKTNGEILDELLTKWEKMGYRFGTLEELTGGAAN